MMMMRSVVWSMSVSRSERSCSVAIANRSVAAAGEAEALDRGNPDVRYLFLSPPVGSRRGSSIALSWGRSKRFAE